MKKVFSATLVVMILVSCKTSKETTETKPVETKVEAAATPETKDSLLVSLERTPCYGQCPMYKFSIYNSGYALYEGKRFVEKEGKFETRIKASVLEEIKTRAKAINYFDFRDEYPKKASDFPAVKTSMVLDGKRKDIMDGSGAPSALKEFEAYLDSIKGAVDWKEVK